MASDAALLAPVKPRPLTNNLSRVVKEIDDLKAREADAEAAFLALRRKRLMLEAGLHHRLYGWKAGDTVEWVQRVERMVKKKLTTTTRKYRGRVLGWNGTEFKARLLKAGGTESTRVVSVPLLYARKVDA